MTSSSTKKVSSTTRKSSTSTKKTSTTKKSSTTTRKSSTSTKMTSTTKKSSTTTKKSSTTTKKSTVTPMTTTKSTTKSTAAAVPTAACIKDFAEYPTQKTGTVGCPASTTCRAGTAPSCPIAKYWLDAHNAARINTTYVGTYKPAPLTHSCYLEATAYRFADMLASSCKFGHSSKYYPGNTWTNATLGGWQDTVGENLQLRVVTRPETASQEGLQAWAMDEWTVKEKPNFQPGSVTNCKYTYEQGSLSYCGHLAQTIAIGAKFMYVPAEVKTRASGGFRAAGGHYQPIPQNIASRD